MTKWKPTPGLICDCDKTPAGKVIFECYKCGEKDCPHHEPLHYHHDGCPACIKDEFKASRGEKEMK